MVEKCTLLSIQFHVNPVGLIFILFQLQSFQAYNLIARKNSVYKNILLNSLMCDYMTTTQFLVDIGIFTHKEGEVVIIGDTKYKFRTIINIFSSTRISWEVIWNCNPSVYRPINIGKASCSLKTTVRTIYQRISDIFNSDGT